MAAAAEGAARWAAAAEAGRGKGLNSESVCGLAGGGGGIVGLDPLQLLGML